MLAALGGAGAVASADLKERVKAKGEAFLKGHDSVPGLDKAKQLLGMGGGSGGSGGGRGGDTAYGQTGQGSTQKYEGKSLNNTSNANFKTATKYDEKTGGQRNMTAKEFIAEKATQGQDIGKQYAAQMKAKQDAKNAKKNEEEKPLPENLTGGTRENS